MVAVGNGKGRGLSVLAAEGLVTKYTYRCLPAFSTAALQAETPFFTVLGGGIRQWHRLWLSVFAEEGLDTKHTCRRPPAFCMPT